MVTPSGLVSLKFEKADLTLDLAGPLNNGISGAQIGTCSLRTNQAATPGERNDARARNVRNS